MKQKITDEELNERIRLNYDRLCYGEYYQIGTVFQEETTEWPGDMEGRALLAFTAHFELSGKKIPCMEELIRLLPEKLNADGFLGPRRDEMMREQQLSGHSWLLRGLCEYYEATGEKAVLPIVRKIVEGLYLPDRGRYASYPIRREKKDEGGVGGNAADIIGSWQLSTDIGCAFMSIDGLSHAYAVLGDEAIRQLLDEMIGVYLAIDKAALRVQTHCTLTAARGMMRLYQLTKEAGYLDGAKSIYELYTKGGGMTLSYQNLNWWRRPDTWTEPCAIVDSMMLALELYKATGNEAYRTAAARVYHNGFATAQRDNGGAGTDTLVTAGSPWTELYAQMYEAYFCCTMRFAEGLCYAKKNRDLLYAETTGSVKRTENGTYEDGDILYGEANEVLRPYAGDAVTVDGHRLTPLVKFYKVPRAVMEQGRLKLLF